MCLSTTGLTLPSRGRATSGFACCCTPLTSNVRALRMQSLFSRIVKLQPFAGASRRAAQSVLPAAEPVRLPELQALVRANASSHWSSLVSSQSRSLPLARARSAPLCMHRGHGHVSASPTRALRAGVLRRAVSPWGRLSAAASGLHLIAWPVRQGGSLAPRVQRQSHGLPPAAP